MLRDRNLDHRQRPRRAALVLLAGTDEQKREWLLLLLEEPILCAFALTEPGAGSDVSAIQIIAVRDGADYVLNGYVHHERRSRIVAGRVRLDDREAGDRGLDGLRRPDHAA